MGGLPAAAVVWPGYNPRIGRPVALVTGALQARAVGAVIAMAISPVRNIDDIGPAAWLRRLKG